MHISKIGGFYTEEEWINIVENHPNVISIHEFENSRIKTYGYAIIRIENKVYGRFLWNWEKGIIELEMRETYLVETFKTFIDIAHQFNGQFFYKRNQIFDIDKHLPLPRVQIQKEIQYFNNISFENIRWLAIRESNLDQILDYLKLKVEGKVPINNEAICDEIFITPAYNNWRIIVGLDISYLLGLTTKSNSEDNLISLSKALQKLSKALIEVQYFEYNMKSNVNGYFKAVNGKLVYCYWESEMNVFTKGKLPKEIKYIHPTSAHEISSIWSIDPLDFCYIKEFQNEIGLTLKMKQKSSL